MRQTKTVEINGRKYLIGHWQVDKSLKTLVWLTKTFGEGFVTLFTSGAASSILLEEDVEKRQKDAEEVSPEEESKLMKEFLASVIDRLDEDAYVKYSRIVVEGVKCNGKDINFSQHFIGRLDELHKLMLEVLRMQYSDFLGAGQESDLLEE